MGRDKITITYTGEDLAGAAGLRRYLEWARDTCAPLRLERHCRPERGALPISKPLGLKNVYVDLNLDLRIADRVVSGALHPAAVATQQTA